MRDARARLDAVPLVRLGWYPTPVEELSRLCAALGGGPRLLVKRDDAIGFAFGGNKVRKIELVAAEALAAGADTLITAGGVQSNHARVTAAAAARLGLQAVVVVNGSPPAKPTANALIDALVGARIHYVATRDARAPAMNAIAARLREEGRSPFVIPVGASTPTGALAYARAVFELVDQDVRPDVIIHSTSSAGTQAGLLAGCALAGLPARVIGISADDPAEAIAAQIRALVAGVEERLALAPGTLARSPLVAIDIDDSEVGDGYGVPTPASLEATALAARTEALFLDPTYTAKAMAALVKYVRARRFREADTVLFWHTGGQIGLFA